MNLYHLVHEPRRVLDDMIETRKSAFDAKLPEADRRLATVDVAGINRRRDELRARLEAAIHDRDTDCARDRGRSASGSTCWPASNRSSRLHAGDASYDDAREKARLARGVVTWNLDAAWKTRVWQASVRMRELDASVYDARSRETGTSQRARGRPGETLPSGRRVQRMTPRVADLAMRVDNAK